jgi:hypothetical protein
VSITLWYTCKMEAGSRPAYWWPLVCEVLRDHHFRFGDPERTGKTSIYFYHRTLSPYDGENEEHEDTIGSFRDVWDEVYQEVGGVTVPFWWKETDFSIDVMSVSLAPVQGLPQVSIDFLLTGSQIYSFPPEEAREMIRPVLFCFKDLCALCNPVSAEVYWEDTAHVYEPWALVGEIPPDRNALRNPSRYPAGVHPPSEYRLIKEPLPNGKFFFQFDPIPIPTLRGWEKDPQMMGWEFLSLFEQGEDKIDAV